MNFDNTRVNIDLDVISRNFDAVREKAGVPVMAVVKADAYGHGAIQVARWLQDKCAFFGVSSMLEAMEIRRAGLRTPILILGHTPVQAFTTAIMENIRPTIYRYEDAVALSEQGIVVEGNLRQVHKLFEEAQMLAISFVTEDLNGEEVEIAGVFGVGLLDAACPFAKVFKVLVVRFVSQEITAQSGVLPHLAHRGFGFGLQFGAHEDGLQPRTVAEVEGFQRIRLGIDVGKGMGESAILQLAVALYGAELSGRNAVPCKDGYLGLLSFLFATGLHLGGKEQCGAEQHCQ